MKGSVNSIDKFARGSGRLGGVRLVEPGMACLRDRDPGPEARSRFGKRLLPAKSGLDTPVHNAARHRHVAVAVPGRRAVATSAGASRKTGVRSGVSFAGGQTALWNFELNLPAMSRVWLWGRGCQRAKRAGQEASLGRSAGLQPALGLG